jgi:hypothetical protein
LHEIAAAQLAVERQIEQREFALAIANFEANPIAQMSLSLSGAFCPTSLPLFQGSRRPDIAVGANMLNSYCFKGSSESEIHLMEGIPTGRQFSVLRFNRANSAGDLERVITTPNSHWSPSALRTEEMNFPFGPTAIAVFGAEMPQVRHS